MGRNKRWVLGLGLVGLLAFTGTAQAALNDLLDGTVKDHTTNLIWLQNWNVNGLQDWDTQMNWADTLDFAGSTDWRLPEISEYTALFTAYGDLTEVTQFRNVQSSAYWSGTESTATFAWLFDPRGFQTPNGFKSGRFFGVAVRPGDVTAPVSPPVVSDVVATPNPVAVQGIFDLTATASGNAVIGGAAWVLNETKEPMEAADGNFDTPTEELFAQIMAPYEAGTYPLCVNATDAAGKTSDDTCINLVVYDPSAGFVTGGGWIWSPTGALVSDSAVEGPANFGFVSRYRRGANVPDGSTQFVFQAGDLNFHSNTYEWLVVTGSNYAMFKGAGTVNGANAETGQPYQFMIWAGDNDPDTFRIKIWYEDDGEVPVYDNGTNQPIGGGQIIVHTGGKKYGLMTPRRR